MSIARMLRDRERGRPGALLDRHAPVDAVFLRRVVARRPVIGAAVVPDHDVALAPRVAVPGPGLDHATGQLFDERVALPLAETLDAQDLAGVEVERPAASLGMRADKRVEDGSPVAI